MTKLSTELERGPTHHLPCQGPSSAWCWGLTAASSAPSPLSLAALAWGISLCLSFLLRGWAGLLGQEGLPQVTHQEPCVCTGAGNHQAARREHLTGGPLLEGLNKLPKGSMAKLLSSERRMARWRIGQPSSAQPQGSLSGLIDRSSCRMETEELTHQMTSYGNASGLSQGPSPSPDGGDTGEEREMPAAPHTLPAEKPCTEQDICIAARTDTTMSPRATPRGDHQRYLRGTWQGAGGPMSAGRSQSQLCWNSLLSP